MRLCPALFALALTASSASAEDIVIPTTPGALHGTLLTAGASAVLILAGSGPTDRDGNNTIGLHTDMYRMLAEGLAAKGIVSLRYDKRGVGESRGAMTAEADLRFQTYADDAVAMATALRKRTGAKCVWLLGHSEGALVAEVAAQKPDGICGLILVSGVGRKLGVLIRDQLQANPANPPELKSAADGILASLESGTTVSDVPPPLAALFRPSVQPYLISEISLDPPALLAATKLPVLVLQGETDMQTSVADAKLLAAARPGIALTVLPGVNHLLKIAPADRAANMATYSNPALPLAPGVVDKIAAFIHGHAS
jgi:pimeloyl-ACP methyl ester carboxylesterase